MISKCEKLLDDLQHGKVTIAPSETTLKNGFDVTLKNEDYTLGKVIEYYLYEQNFIANKDLSFCGFRKPHPHSTDSIIRVAFQNEIDSVGVSGYVQAAADNTITAFKKLIEQLGGNIKKSERSLALGSGLGQGQGSSSVSKGKESRRSSSPKKSAAGPAVEEDPEVLKLSKELSDFSVGASTKTSKSKSKASLGSKLNLSSIKSALTKTQPPEGEEEEEEEEK